MARDVVISTKRQPEGPEPGFKVEGATLETVTPFLTMLLMILREVIRDEECLTKNKGKPQISSIIMAHLH
ncbi:hypothetical protein Dsin_013859 [Dipteronia sinensis]|uniref:Uncharacterized protein n=1 Tax=Dipteronia sinensis TaxID=43782 RepID=A0AAE0ALZ6_9ROSI|nr:hypothetical protein Dsin_013859 [Dipteronia sinensis]